MKNYEKKRAKNNRTTFVAEEEISDLKKHLLSKSSKNTSPLNKIINLSMEDGIGLVEDNSVDLLFLDPPYNLTKDYGNNTFKQTKQSKYESIFENWFLLLLPKLKTTASIYVCCDWKTSQAIFNVLKRHVIVQNRITWEREKGRGAKSNWKNCSEDVWFATLSSDYIFNVDAVKLKRKVIAPYRVNGEAKDWQHEAGQKFRLTHPSNLWTDITIPFWSMPENTDHPTQKPEKLVAKTILASTNENDLVLDPFIGSGTTAVVAKKLGRKYIPPMHVDLGQGLLQLITEIQDDPTPSKMSVEL